MTPDGMSLPVKDTCVIELRGRQSSWSGDVSNSCSGIVVDAAKGLVVTTASGFHPFIDENHRKVLERTRLLNCEWFKDVQVRVTVEVDGRSKQDDTSKRLLSIDRTTEQYKGEVLQICKVSSFESQLSRLFSPSDGWRIADVHRDTDGRGSNLPPVQSLHVLSSFVLIKLGGWQARRQNISISQHLCIGETLYAVATPFGGMGMAVFMNSVSRGVVSNVAGRRDGDASLFVTDARSVPGCEGGALYKGAYPHNLQLVGMIVAPMCWKKDEWIGLAIGCRLQPILQAFREGRKTRNESKHDLISGRTSSTCNQKSIDASCQRVFSSPRVVLIKNQSSWGSGILVSSDPALVLTCSHVIRGASTVTVRVDSDSGQSWYCADVLYRNKREHPVFDVGLISLRDYGDKCLRELEIAESCNEGDDVLVAGHPVFDSTHNMGLTVTRGVVARVTSVGRTPVMIQSSCAVNRGASGGALMSTSGAFIGLVCCNAKEMTTGATYPHINFSVPMSLIWPVLREYIHSRDASLLKAFEVEDKIVQGLWTLEGQLETSHNGPARYVTSKL